MTSLSVAYSPVATFARTRSAISFGSVMLSCWVVRMRTSGNRVGLNPTLSSFRFPKAFADREHNFDHDRALNARLSHPCPLFSISYVPSAPFHADNSGSNPVGDANRIKH